VTFNIVKWGNFLHLTCKIGQVYKVCKPGRQ